MAPRERRERREMAFDQPDFPWPRNYMRPTREEEARMRAYSNRFYERENALFEERGLYTARSREIAIQERNRTANALRPPSLLTEEQILQTELQRLHIAENKVSRLRDERESYMQNRNRLLLPFRMARGEYMQRQIRMAERDLENVKGSLSFQVGDPVSEGQFVATVEGVTVTQESLAAVTNVGNPIGPAHPAADISAEVAARAEQRGAALAEYRAQEEARQISTTSAVEVAERPDQVPQVSEYLSQRAELEAAMDRRVVEEMAQELEAMRVRSSMPSAPTHVPHSHGHSSQTGEGELDTISI